MVDRLEIKRKKKIAGTEETWRIECPTAFSSNFRGERHSCRGTKKNSIIAAPVGRRRPLSSDSSLPFSPFDVDGLLPGLYQAASTHSNGRNVIEPFLHRREHFTPAIGEEITAVLATCWSRLWQMPSFVATIPHRRRITFTSRASVDVVYALSIASNGRKKSSLPLARANFVKAGLIWFRASALSFIELT